MNIYSCTRTFGAEVHWSNIRVKRWHNKYENSELYWKTQLLLKWFAYQVQSCWNTDLWSRGTKFWDTLYTFWVTSPIHAYTLRFPLCRSHLTRLTSMSRRFQGQFYFEIKVRGKIQVKFCSLIINMVNEKVAVRWRPYTGLLVVALSKWKSLA